MRIRTIKPEFWSDEKLSMLDPLTRLVFLGLISCLADDSGRLVDSVKQIDGMLFPHTEDSSREPLEILARLSRISRYTAANGQKIIQIANWAKHQRIDKPAKYTLPPSLNGAREIPANSPQSPREDLAASTRDSSEVLEKTTLSDLGPRTLELGPRNLDLGKKAEAAADVFSQGGESENPAAAEPAVSNAGTATAPEQPEQQDRTRIAVRAAWDRLNVSLPSEVGRMSLRTLLVAMPHGFVRLQIVQVLERMLAGAEGEEQASPEQLEIALRDYAMNGFSSGGFNLKHFRGYVGRALLGPDEGGETTPESLLRALKEIS